MILNAWGSKYASKYDSRELSVERGFISSAHYGFRGIWFKVSLNYILFNSISQGNITPYFHNVSLSDSSGSVSLETNCIFDIIHSIVFFCFFLFCFTVYSLHYFDLLFLLFLSGCFLVNIILAPVSNSSDFCRRRI